ncbi:MAG: pyridoxamine 5'-phosphate oxidase family protein [Candidatus Binataceae bacterium]
MGKIYERIDDPIARFIAAQHLFFVATAPLGRNGHVNLSPKGLDTFRIVGPNTVAYLDLTGSGIETLSHVRENGRIVLMFCAFEGPPRILRIHGRGEAIEPGDPRFAEMRPMFPGLPGARAIIIVTVTRVADSCGYAVPLYRYEGERNQLVEWAERKRTDEMEKYRTEKNRASIDGIAGLAPRAGKDFS